MLTVDDTRDAFPGSPCHMAVLPVGAVEQHGAHLPVGTDLFFADALARAIAERLEAYLLPAVAISASIEHRQARGTVYLRAETLAHVVRDIADSLCDSGFARLLVVNFHGGNWILKPTIRELNRRSPEFRTILLTPDLPPARAAEIFEHPVGDIHAGEFETSLMLHLYPDKVRPVAGKAEPAYPPQSFLDYFDASELTPAGHWGWPAAASAAKGEKAFAALVEHALQTVEKIEEMGRRLGK